MERLIYTSVAAEGIGGGDVFEIVETSARNNVKRDISGFLIFKHGRFLQLVEGETDALEELMQSLQRDPRHHSLKILRRSVTGHRDFEGWRMRRFEAQDSGRHPREIAEKMRQSDARGTIVALVEDFLGG